MAWGMFKWRNRGPCGVVTLCLRMGLTRNWSCSPQRNVGSNSRTFRVCNPAVVSFYTLFSIATRDARFLLSCGGGDKCLMLRLYCGLLYMVNFRSADHPDDEYSTPCCTDI